MKKIPVSEQKMRSYAMKAINRVRANKAVKWSVSVSVLTKQSRRVQGLSRMRLIREGVCPV